MRLGRPRRRVMLAELRALRDRLDAAIAELEPLAGVLSAWRAVGAPESAAEPVGHPSSTDIGTAAAAEADTAPSGVSEPSHHAAPPETRVCARAGCGERFVPKNPRQKFCGRRCSQLAWTERQPVATPRKALGRPHKGSCPTRPPDPSAAAGEPARTEQHGSGNGRAASGEDAGRCPICFTESPSGEPCSEACRRTYERINPPVAESMELSA